MNFVFCGDIMPGGVLPYQDTYIDDNVLSYIRHFDLRIATLECGIGTNIPFDDQKMADNKSIVYARDEDLFRLKEMDINIVSLANNHAFDLGLEGFENTISLLDNMGIKYCGAGHNLSEAKQPVIINMDGKSIAFIGCMLDYPRPVIFHIATDNSYGVYKENIDILIKDIMDAKQKYDYVIVMPHWGIEHSYYPPAWCKECGYKMLDAGADLVIGSHPHIINPVIKHNGKYIFFSLGNFLFPDKCMQPPRPVYYPTSITEFKSLKRVWTYPYRIKEPVVAVWKGRNRIGMVAEITLNRRKKFESAYKLILLDEKNKLHFYQSIIYRLRFTLLAVLIHFPYYHKIRQFLESKFNIFRKIIDKNKIFNIPIQAEEYK
jgi:poly-gamma-glutamate synthesis protein (capsule biosynthesis protein)